MGCLSKKSIIDEISDYLNIGSWSNTEINLFRRDLRRMSVSSLEMLLGSLRRVYV